MKTPHAQPSARQEPTQGKLRLSAQDEAIAAVCAEVYRLTGQTITDNDPILLAALFQSELMRKAGADITTAFEQTVAQAIAMLADAVKEERAQAANLDKSVAAAFQQIANGAKAAGDAELATMQGRFARMAAETLDQVRREAQRAVPNNYRWKMTLAAVAGLAAGLLASVLLHHQEAPRYSDEQARLIHNGLLLDDAWPKLPKAARAAFGVQPKAPATLPAADKP